MEDQVDMVSEWIEAEREEAIRRARQKLPPRNPGECDRCGENMPHLVGGVCVPCSEGKWKE